MLHCLVFRLRMAFRTSDGVGKLNKWIQGWDVANNLCGAACGGLRQFLLQRVCYVAEIGIQFVNIYHFIVFNQGLYLLHFSSSRSIS